MNWDNDLLTDFITSRSIDIDCVMYQEPEPPESNPLHEDLVSLKEIEFAKEIKEYLGDVSLNDPNNYVAKSVRVMIAGSDTKHIDLDQYTNEDIEEYHNYLIEYTRVRELNDSIMYVPLNRVPIFALLRDDFNEKNVLIFSNSSFNPFAVGLTEFDQLIDRSIHNNTRYYRLLSEERISEILQNVNFDSLRRRLIEAGYEKRVEEINELLEEY